MDPSTAGGPADPPYLSGVSGRSRGAGRCAARCSTSRPTRRACRGGRPWRAPPAARRRGGGCSRSCVARPAQLALARAAAAELARSRHDVEVRLIAPAPGAGKWQNLNAALAAHPAAGRDWLLVLDDDVVLPRGFLDAFLALSEAFGFELAQPAHAHRSHAAWAVTRRRRGVVARRTRFVEIGPVTALHAPAFAELLPFPDLRMGWGLDAHWGAVAAARGWPVGIVDAVPVRHTRACRRRVRA